MIERGSTQTGVDWFLSHSSGWTSLVFTRHLGSLLRDQAALPASCKRPPAFFSSSSVGIGEDSPASLDERRLYHPDHSTSGYACQNHSRDSSRDAAGKATGKTGAACGLFLVSCVSSRRGQQRTHIDFKRFCNIRKRV